FRNDPQMAQKAEAVSSIALDITELLTKLDYRATQVVPPLKIAYHSACSLQHGQKVTSEPVKLLEKAGFDVTPVPESHLCCGSAGTYNLLQPELAGTLAARKAANIESTGADAVAAGNLGCIIQIAGATDIPVMHSVELLDWASGGPCPQALEKFALPDGPQTHSPPGPTEFIISPGA
ncbi:MAG TPA: glycolate oxidase iron-sulfur subunit, partial [Rhodobacteraceae bacterium]|nr:glycolate oxidase iron-sulfur subunit [Paracoccaceae bacterium]